MLEAHACCQEVLCMPAPGSAESLQSPGFLCKLDPTNDWSCTAAPSPHAPPPPPPPAAAPQKRADGRVVATPYAKKLAKDLGVDLNNVAGGLFRRPSVAGICTKGLGKGPDVGQVPLTSSTVW